MVQQHWAWVLLISLGTLVVLWLLVGVSTGRWNPGELARGTDGRPSTSKLQFVLWTAVALFSYMAVYVARATRGYYDPVQDIPSNLLVAVGLSAATAVGAKAVTVAYVNSGRVAKQLTSTPATAADVFQDDAGLLDLSKVQMIAWTLIAVGTYLTRLISQINAFLLLPNGQVPLNLVGLPDLDPALMVLMGLGQGAYLGKKLVTTTTPRLTGLQPAAGKVGISITLQGIAFGNDQAAVGGVILLNGQPADVAASSWSDTQVTFTLPATQPDGTAWPSGQAVLVSLLVAGQPSANTLSFTVTT